MSTPTPSSSIHALPSSSSLPPTLPDAPRVNGRFSCAVILPLDLPTAYAQLGRVERLGDIGRLAKPTERVDVFPTEFSTSLGDVDALKNPYALACGPVEEGAHFRRAKFLLTEAFDYKVAKFAVTLAGSQTELAKPDFINGTASVLYSTYGAKSKVWVRKLRVMERLPDQGGKPRTKVTETVSVTTPRIYWPLVKMTAKKEHRTHMLQYGKLFPDHNVRATLA